jgi:hypothetical protein
MIKPRPQVCATSLQNASHERYKSLSGVFCLMVLREHVANLGVSRGVWNANLVKTQPEAPDCRGASRDDIARKSGRRTTSKRLTNNPMKSTASVSSHGLNEDKSSRMEILATSLTATAKTGLGVLVTRQEPRRRKDRCTVNDIGSHRIWVCLDVVH